MRGTIISLLATGISLLASLTTRNRNNMGMWPQILQSISPRQKNRWGMPILLALGIGFIYILTRYRNIGMQQMMKPIVNMGTNKGMWQMMQPLTNIMKNRGIQEDLSQQIQYDGQSRS